MKSNRFQSLARNSTLTLVTLLCGLTIVPLQVSAENVGSTTSSTNLGNAFSVNTSSNAINRLTPGTLYARPNCDVEDPPPICGGEKPPKPNPTQSQGPIVPVFQVSETMTDGCSGDVVISRTYSNSFNPQSIDGLYLKRDASGNTQWSGQMPVSGHTYIRWWCHSTTGNWADPGTWRLNGGYIGTDCKGDWDQGSVNSCKPTGSIDLGSSAVEGWTPERSRCSSNRTQFISARLGRDRLLQIQCIE